MTQLIIPPQSSHHHPQWHLEKLQVPEHLWKGKIRSPGSLIRFTKTESVLPGGLELILSWSAIKNGENSKKLSFPEYFVFSRHAWIWPSCPSVPSPPAHSRDGLFIWVIFYLLFEIWHFFFMLSLIFFPTGEATDAAGRAGTASASAPHPGSGARPSQSPPSGGETGFSQPQRDKQGFGDRPGGTGKGDCDHNSGSSWGATPSSLGTGIFGSIRVLGAKPAFWATWTKNPRIALKMAMGEEIWGRMKGPASSSGFSSQGEESRDVRSASGKHTDINIYIYVPNFFWNIFIFLIYV